MHKTAPDGDCNQVVQLHVKVINRCSVPFSPFSFFKTKELTQGRMSRSTIANIGLFSISSIQRKMWLGISYSILRQVYNEPSLMKHLDNIFIWKESDVNLAVLYVEGLNITKDFFLLTNVFLFANGIVYSLQSLQMENKTLLSKGYHHCFDIFSRHTKACTFFDTLKKIRIYLFNLLVSTLQIDYHTVSKFLAVLITSFQKQMFSSTILGGQIVCKH